MKTLMITVLAATAVFYAFVPPKVNSNKWPNQVAAYYHKNVGDSLASKAIGSAGAGSLQHGKLMPFKGDNYFYFSQKSYLMGRAYTTDKVQKATLSTYKQLAKLYPSRQFGLMECSYKKGGKFWPHHTHQNGQSIDFMSPLEQNGKPYTDLDDKGIAHYWLEFDETGRYAADTSVQIDFNLLAHHILLLNQAARQEGIKITKVILMLELKDELFATHYGKQLKKSGIYFAQRLSNMVNKEHDDHYHIDFGQVK